jgi:2-polyprenyl-6-methoxyphenol hydroxylase-like FAD-dependent oxidoreductase
MIYQPLLEQILREGIKRFDHVQLRCGHRVVNIEHVTPTSLLRLIVLLMTLQVCLRC